MQNYPRFIAVSMVFSLAIFAWGCACTGGNPGYSGTAGSAVAAGTLPPIGGPGNRIRGNLSDVEFLIESVERKGDLDFVLRGRILSARPAGSLESIAEAGQSLSLRPARPRGKPGPDDDAGRRLIALGSAPAGRKIRCSITLEGDGTWRIISVDK